MKVTVRGVEIDIEQLEDGRFVKPALGQFTKSGRGCTWLDDCRVPTQPRTTHKDGNRRTTGLNPYHGANELEISEATPGATGRFPANLLVEDQALNGHSKFFDLDSWADTLPFLAVPKASKSEKNKGLEGFDDKNAMRVNAPRENEEAKHATLTKNHHPTVKPLKLMSYLITLTTRPGDTVLDPFVGSGTTVVAAEQLGRVGIGIEREAEYAEIARARVEAFNHVDPEEDKPVRLV